MSGVGNGIVVEVATDDNGMLTMLFDVLTNDINLAAALRIGLGQLDQQQLGLCTGRIAIHLAM